MPRYAVFLRAVNVGGRRVTMDVLRGIVEGADCTHVETLIASGNVALDSPLRSEARLVARLEQALTAGLGFDINLFARSAGDLQTLASVTASRAQDDGTLYVAFLTEPPTASVRRLLAEASTPSDRLEPLGREVLWTCRSSFRDSPFSGPGLERLLGVPTTVRKSTTVVKMANRLLSSQR